MKYGAWQYSSFGMMNYPSVAMRTNVAVERISIIMEDVLAWLIFLHELGVNLKIRGL